MTILLLSFFYLLSNSHQTCLRLCVGPSEGIQLLAYLIIPFFHLPLNVLSTTLPTWLGLSHPLVLGVSHYICNQPLDPLGIHLLCCTHGGEKMAFHDVVRNVFMVIVKDAGFHVSQEQTHVLSPLALQSSHHQINIVLFS